MNSEERTMGINLFILSLYKPFLGWLLYARPIGKQQEQESNEEAAKLWGIWLHSPQRHHLLAVDRYKCKRPLDHFITS